MGNKLSKTQKHAPDTSGIVCVNVKHELEIKQPKPSTSSVGEIISTSTIMESDPDVHDLWTKIGILPDKVAISNPIAINNDEFVVATDRDFNKDLYTNQKYAGIWSYNACL